jgi:hypothetical protein
VEESGSELIGVLFRIFMVELKKITAIVRRVVDSAEKRIGNHMKTS